MIIHLPHASNKIPDPLRDFIVISNNDLATELLRMTDAFTDELFAFPDSVEVQFPISRLLVDVERFLEDDDEPMSKVGMGMIYTHTAHGEILKRELKPAEKGVLLGYYKRHHEMLSKKVRIELEKYGEALILDCHSFPSRPLPCDSNQAVPRPDFCIGTDSFHTPPELTAMVASTLQEMGYSVGIDQPYKGTIVPTEFYCNDRRVMSMMIEVNRNLYMDETDGRQKDSFCTIQIKLDFLFSKIRQTQEMSCSRRKLSPPFKNC